MRPRRRKVDRRAPRGRILPKNKNPFTIQRLLLSRMLQMLSRQGYKAGKRGKGRNDFQKNAGKNGADQKKRVQSGQKPEESKSTSGATKCLSSNSTRAATISTSSESISASKWLKTTALTSEWPKKPTKTMHVYGHTQIQIPGHHHIINYLGPRTSCEKTKAHGCTSEKFGFPYEWFESKDKLDFPGLPDYPAWYSKLKEKFVLSLQEWKECKKLF